MPRPFRELSLALLAGVESLPATLDPVRSWKDSYRGGIIRHKTADIVVSEAAVSVRSSASQDTGPVLHTVTVEVGVMETILCPSRFRN